YRIRGGEPVTMRVSSARLYVDAQGKKRFVLALKYEGQVIAHALAHTSHRDLKNGKNKIYPLRCVSNGMLFFMPMRDQKSGKL
ncbi:MAG TPA: hypothetical protein VE844_06500, partial [Gammaproteobacteria bacterium]|nr:hypothetical protein [Gammaproteobacteria bacterium]